MKQGYLLVLATALACCGCQPRHTPLLLSYDDFGPQCIAYEVVGYLWCMSDGEELVPQDVVVVVYEGPDEAAARSIYGDTGTGGCQYRYVSVKEARRFLREQIAGIEALLAEDPSERKSDDLGVMIDLLKRLQATLSCIESHFDR